MREPPKGGPRIASSLFYDDAGAAIDWLVRAFGGANTQSLCVFVDDVDAMCARARAAGGVIASDPTTTDYGADYWSDRTCEVVDPEGHHWWFMQRMRDQDSGGA